ncbi:MAG: hypothetical protein SGJ21_10970 [Alphaproteobacteria bacterium]|nr:hypothetical protein [Alphaproteobacteria bacterium]
MNVLDFARWMPTLEPHGRNPESWFADPDHSRFIGMQNASSRGCCLILAARAVGLDCGPMNGFNREGVDREFLLGDAGMKSWRSSFFCNLGQGDGAGKRSRAPRLAFEEAAGVI